MRNKYEPGSEVLIKARIEKAAVYEDGVIYRCKLSSYDGVIHNNFEEEDIMMELVDNENETTN